MSSSSAATGRTSRGGERDAAQTERLRQVIQRFFYKAALTIAASRVTLPQIFTNPSTVKFDRWFNIVVDDSDLIARDTSRWSKLDLEDEQRPPPMWIDIYLDAAELPRNQSLVIVDERRRKWDALEALHARSAINHTERRKKDYRVLLERWKVYLGPANDVPQQAAHEPPPFLYKKLVVLFRSLYTLEHSLPACRFVRQVAKDPSNFNVLRPLYRISHGDPDEKEEDLLKAPLYPSKDPTTKRQDFMPTYSSAGPLNIEVEYRTNCNFSIADSDSVISSHLQSMDNKRLGHSDNEKSPQHRYGKELGSVPIHWQTSRSETNQELAYGSMSTFHRRGQPTGTSPMSALRAARDLNEQSSSTSPPVRTPPDHRASQSPKTALKAVDRPSSFQRRVSISFQPFKAGSLSSSPGPIQSAQQSSRPSSEEISHISTSGPQHSRNKSSKESVLQAAHRAAQSPSNDVAVGSPSSASPRPPGPRYSSSFSNRRSRLSSGATQNSKTEEDNTSSGKASQSSSNQPGSCLLGEGEQESSGPLDTDEDNISDFLKLLDQKKELKSFGKKGESSRDASSRKTTAALSRFQQMRDSHAAFTDSLSSSIALQQSPASSPPSRLPPSGPPQLAGASVSTTSSASKPISPHTPHTPAIPSRLSTHATSNDGGQRYSEGRRQPSYGGDGTVESPEAARPSASTAIDIPLSPDRHRGLNRQRRSSSIVHAHRGVAEETGMRSASVPGGPAAAAAAAEDHQDLSLDELFATQDHPVSSTAPGQSSSGREHPGTQSHGPSLDNEGGGTGNSGSASADASAQQGSGSASAAPPFKSRLTRASGGRGSPSSAGKGSSFSADRRGSSGAGARRGSFSSARGGVAAHGASASAMDDDEPLLFTMSELGTQSRRSLEEAVAAAGGAPTGRDVGTHGSGDRDSGSGAGGDSSGASSAARRGSFASRRRGLWP